MRANWKLLCENSLDGYHAMPTHKTYFDYIDSLWSERPKGVQGEGRALGNGHTVMEYSGIFGRPTALWTPLFPEDTKEEIAATRNRLVEQYGEERAKSMCENSRNLLIYPNLVINDVMAITVRYFEPIAPDHIDVTAWEMAPREESADLLATRLDSFLTFLGPGGFATPDDAEALASCQAGFQATGVEWSDISRGMHREAQATDELQMRGFWRQWHGHMMGLGNVDVQDKKPEKQRAAAGADD